MLFTRARISINNSQLLAARTSSLSLAWAEQALTRAQASAIVNLLSNSSRARVLVWLQALKVARQDRPAPVCPCDLAPPVARKACRAREAFQRKPARRRASKALAKWALIIRLARSNCRVRASSNSTYRKLPTLAICAII